MAKKIGAKKDTWNAQSILCAPRIAAAHGASEQAVGGFWGDWATVLNRSTAHDITWESATKAS